MLAGCPDCGGNKFQFRPKGSVSVTESQSRPDVPESTPSKSTDPGKTRTTTLREWARKKVTSGSGTADPSPPSGQPASTRQTTSTRQSASAGSSSTGSSTDAEQSTSTTRLESFADTSGDSPDAESTADPTTDGPPTTADPPTDDAEAVETSDQEDVAQADARSGVVRKNELPDLPATDEDRPPEEGIPANRPTQDRPPAGGPPENRSPQDHPSEDHEPRPDLAQLREELNDQFESIKVVEPGQYELNLMELYDREEYIIELQENGRYVIEVPDAWDAVDT
jgi:predicted  nucleic acid-binding Zn-ribbon protein